MHKHTVEHKYNIGDILEGSHLPKNLVHLLIEDIKYWYNMPYKYCVRNLEEDVTYEKTIDLLDKSLFYRKVA